MDRVSTANTHQSALLNILSAQNRQTDAETQVETGKVATDLKGYSVQADTLTATRSLQARIGSYISTAQSLSSTLDVQDQALGQLSSNTESARGAVAEAVATGDASGLMTSLQGFLSQATDALNTQYQGRYLFSGGQSDTAPVSSSLTMADLTAAPSIPGLFSNDQLATTSRLDDNLTVKTNFLASNLAQPLFQAMQAVEAVNEPPTGPLSGTLTAAQQTALQNVLPQFDAAFDNVNDAVAQNGGLQNRVTTIQTGLTDRQNALLGVASDITNVDMSQAVSNLQLAQTAMQASAQVFATLNGASLLSVLAPSTGSTV